MAVHLLPPRGHVCSLSFNLGTQVAATCLYIYCRQEARPYMLIDFSDHLSVNVYTLGAVYLQASLVSLFFFLSAA